MLLAPTERIKALIRDAEKFAKRVGAFRLAASDWNQVVEIYHQNRPLICRGDYRGDWKHPWEQLVTWNADLEIWQSTIRAGFVNGRAAEVESPSGTKLLTAEDATLPLYARNFRNIGPDGPATGVTGEGLNKTVAFEAVPEFFQALGVGEPPSASFDAFGAQAQEASRYQEDAVNERKLLRAVDVVLTQDRPAAKTEITQVGDATEFGVSYELGPNHRDNPYLRLRSSYTAETESADTASDIAGGITDDPFDQLHMATIYLVSQRGETLNAEPDSTWEPYVQHRVFWNLNHATNRPVESENFEPLRLPVPLAGGVAEGFANATLAQIENNFELILAFLASKRLDGKFWTT